MDAVLFLDVDWLPLRIEHWTTAIADVVSEKVEVIEWAPDRIIRGVTRTYPMPSVVRVLRPFKRNRQAIKFSRINVYTRDKFTCQYCGTYYGHSPAELNFDHVVPRSKGGRTCWENIVTACYECNNEKKRNRTLEEAGMKLLRTPKKPAYLPTVRVKFDSHRMPAEWRNYWSVGLDK